MRHRPHEWARVARGEKRATLKILYVAHNERDERRGAAYADIALLRELVRRGHQVEDVWDVGSPRRIRHDNLHLLLEAPSKCAAVVRGRLGSSPADIVIVNQPLGYRAARATRGMRGGPLFVARSHGWEPFVAEARREFARGERPRSMPRELGSRILGSLLARQPRRLLTFAHGLILGSLDDLNGIASAGDFARDRMVAVEPGIPPEFLGPPIRGFDLTRARRLLYVGQFAAFKGPGLVARAMSLVLSADPTVSASWVCAESDHAAVRGLFPGSVQSRLSLLPWLRREELVKVYDDHGVFIFPSYYEGFGQTFLEAMARGMVVLATGVGGMKQVIQTGENGFLFERGDAAGIADRAIELTREPERMAGIGALARDTSELMTWERSGEKLEAFLLGLLALEGRTSPEPGAA